jgi:hypothetical protein
LPVALKIAVVSALVRGQSITLAGGSTVGGVTTTGGGSTTTGGVTTGVSAASSVSAWALNAAAVERSNAIVALAIGEGSWGCERCRGGGRRG